MGPVLHLDLETRSAVDLKKVGAHRYAEDVTTEIICGSYRFGDGPVQHWVGEFPPMKVREHINNGGQVAGHNQAFERAIWNAIIAEFDPLYFMDPEDQDCTMARAAAVGLPHSLDNLGQALNLDIQKDKAGHALMLKMCKPRTKEPLTWHESPEEIERLAAYCDRDVETECAADLRLPALSDRERRVWVLDQTINDRGFAVDLPKVRLAYEAVLEAQRRADQEMFRLTGGAVARTSQVKRLVDWLNSRHVVCESVADGEIDEILVTARLFDDDQAEAALQLRRASAGAFKFEAMLRAVCADGRIRGSLQYHGTHGGRWAGRVVQPQNFKRVAEEDAARVGASLELLERGCDARSFLDALSLFDDKPLEVLSLLARPMIVARPGHKLVDADFSNIEGRLNAWFAGEAWKLQAFRDFDAGTGPDLYKVAAARALGKTAAEVTKTERQENGKVSELAAGYQGGARAFQKMAAKSGLNLSAARALELRDGWRESNPAIVASWTLYQEAAIAAVQAPGCIVPVLGGKVQYLKPKDADFLWCRLPSGRVISYARPKLGWSSKIVTVDDEEVELDSYGLTFWGQKDGRWKKLDLYGGMQCAHIVSGTARDLLVEAMFAVEAAGYPTVLTVHDEILAEVPEGFGSAQEFQDIMLASRPAWAKGLPLAVSAWEDERYVK